MAKALTKDEKTNLVLSKVPTEHKQACINSDIHRQLETKIGFGEMLNILDSLVKSKRITAIKEPGRNALYHQGTENFLQAPEIPSTNDMATSQAKAITERTAIKKPTKRGRPAKKPATENTAKPSDAGATIQEVAKSLADVGKVMADKKQVQSIEPEQTEEQGTNMTQVTAKVVTVPIIQLTEQVSYTLKINDRTFGPLTKQETWHGITRYAGEIQGKSSYDSGHEYTKTEPAEIIAIEDPNSFLQKVWGQEIQLNGQTIKILNASENIKAAINEAYEEVEA